MLGKNIEGGGSKKIRFQFTNHDEQEFEIGNLNKEEALDALSEMDRNQTDKADIGRNMYTLTGNKLSVVVADSTNATSLQDKNW